MVSEGEETMDAIITAVAAIAVARTVRRTRRPRAVVAAERALVASIRHALNNSAVAVERALDILFERQTRDEQVAYVTRHDNEVGFSQADARTGTWLVTVVMAEGRSQGRPAGQLLRGKALEIGRRVALHYARTQLLAVAQEKAEAEKNAYCVPTPEQVMGADVVENNRREARFEDGVEADVEAEEQADRCCSCPFADGCHDGYYYDCNGIERPCA
jgi:hypothetical protein